ncbi:DUF1801 domain-containing protein [Chryseobacterium taklimakanense]|uniref:DUF1801 domain-containing protein n=1 Tax=Chryseobacterium taklimakanense TaxID=536441 RepID=A0A3G8WNJ6_9FLAO|nr:DUF1801 domain-containing protein [Chryseobacterium taklimakanense]AZI21057.1 DUF1801 domain-containing protein [Chryseobacterium taklimakanense]
MKTEAENVKDFLEKVPEERKEVIKKLYKTISQNLPEGFAEGISNGMMGWVVPLDIYPAGYHCTPGKPLPFLGMASQKNSVNLYHMEIYAKPELHDWFVAEFSKHSKKKLDMGKSCIRFKKPEDIPYELIGELAKKMTSEEWVNLYESQYKSKLKK